MEEVLNYQYQAHTYDMAVEAAWQEKPRIFFVLSEGLGIGKRMLKAAIHGADLEIVKHCTEWGTGSAVPELRLGVLRWIIEEKGVVPKGYMLEVCLRNGNYIGWRYINSLLGHD